MSRTDFTRRITRTVRDASRFPVDRIRVPADTGLLEVVYATAVGHAAAAIARHENGAPDLGAEFVAVQVLAVGRHSASEIETAIRIGRSARAWVLVIDDGTDPEIDAVLRSFGA